jgi:uncharacterized protein YcfL
VRHALLLAGLTLAACAPTPPPPLAAPADPRLILTPAVQASLTASSPLVTVLRDGRLQVVVNLQNPAPMDFPLRVQIDWLDATGRPIDSVTARPQFRSVARSTVTSIDADAPSTQARDFRMTLDLESP